MKPNQTYGNMKPQNVETPTYQNGESPTYEQGIIFEFEIKTAHDGFYLFATKIYTGDNSKYKDGL